MRRTGGSHGKGGIKLNLKGFEKKLAELQAAGKDVDRAAQSAIRESAQIVETELRTQAKASGVPDDVTAEIGRSISVTRGIYDAEVGWTLGSYNPRNPSAGYKAIFLNYGTVRRATRRGYNRGAIQKQPQEGQFIYRAKKNARRKVTKVQREMLKKALGGLK